MANPVLYNAWFCPFAQRAWIALLEKEVTFDYVEQDPYHKTEEWLSINPNGLVPVIIHNGKKVFQSNVCIEYVDEAFQTGKHLMPTDPYERACVRMKCDFITKNLVPPYYRMLQKKGEVERSNAMEDIIKGLKELFEDYDQSVAFFGGNSLNMADIMLAPFAHRYQIVLSHFCNFVVPREGVLQRYYIWYERLCSHYSFTTTLFDNDKLIKSYVRYAEDTVQSQVGQAIREEKTLP